MYRFLTEIIFVVLLSKLFRSLGKPMDKMKRIVFEIFSLVFRVGMIYYLFKRIYVNIDTYIRVFTTNWLLLIMYKTTKNFQIFIFLLFPILFFIILVITIV